MALIDNLLAYWKLDETTGTDVDDAHGTDNLTTSGTPAWVTGKLNNGLQFNGSTTGQRAYRGAYSELTKTSDYSVSFWVKFATLTNNDNTVANYIIEADRFSLNVRNDSGMRIVAAHWDGDQDNHKETQVLSTGTWYHVVYVHTGSTNLVELYLDTVLQDNVGVNQNFQAAAAFMIGNFRDSGQPPMDGIMDEVGIWSKKLSSGERDELYGSGTPPAYPFTAAPTGNSQMMGANF